MRRLAALCGLLSISCLAAGCASNSAQRSFYEAILWQKSPANLMVFDTNGDGKADFRVMDTDRDGVFDQYDWDTNFDGKYDLARTRDQIAQSPYRVIFCLDGVPFEVLDKMWREGHWRDFWPPGKLIATFPSLTNPGFSDFFDTKRTGGYEDLYFNIGENKLAGGALDVASGAAETGGIFYSKFDYTTASMDQGLVYVMSESVARRDVEKMREAMFSRGPLSRREKGAPFIDLKGVSVDPRTKALFIGYLLPPDALSHKYGQNTAPLIDSLQRIEAIAREVIWRTRGEVNMVIFSDHGNDLVPAQKVQFEKALAEAGLRKGDSLGPKHDLVIPAFGLINFMPVYTAEKLKAKVAETFANVEGVDFAVYTAPDGFPMILAGPGRARVYYDGAFERFKYVAEHGDPLKLRGVLNTLKERGRLDKNGFASDRDWFDLTVEHEYPDPLWRIAGAFGAQVRNRAQVLVSLKSGYYFGSRLFEAFCALKSSHGNMERLSTQTFILCTSKNPVSPMRQCQALQWLNGPVAPASRPKTASSRAASDPCPVCP